MRTGLGKLLDEVLFETIPPLLEPAGFATVRRRRVWLRDRADVEQAVAARVDGRTARDGFLSVSVGVGVTYPWEDAERAVVVAGRGYAHSPQALHPTIRVALEWRFDGDELLAFARGLADHVERVVLPAVDRFRDPRGLRDHYLSRGALRPAIELSNAVGDHDLARGLVPAAVAHTVRTIAVDGAGSPAVPGRALALAADNGVELDADDAAFLRAHLAAEIARWREHRPLPAWGEELERRFIASAG